MNHSMHVHIGKRLAYILHRLYGFIYWQPTTSGHETFERISRHEIIHRDKAIGQFVRQRNPGQAQRVALLKHSPYCTIGKIQRDFLADKRTRPFHGYTFRHTFAVAFNERALNMVSIVDAQRMYELLFIQTNYPRSRHRYENHLFWRVRRSRKRTSEQTSVEIVNRTCNRFISAQLNLEKVRYSKPGIDEASNRGKPKSVRCLTRPDRKGRPIRPLKDHRRVRLTQRTRS